MKNKRAQFFAAYVSIFVVFLCGLVIYFYFVQQGNAFNSLVSPKLVLDVRDGLDIFELREKELIEASLVRTSSGRKFCEGDFVKSFREDFIGSVNSNAGMKEFIFSNLSVERRVISEQSKVFSKDFFENVLYPEEGMRCSGKEFILERYGVGKSFKLVGESDGKINFPVDFYFEFEKGYFVVYNGREFIFTETNNIGGVL